MRARNGSAEAEDALFRAVYGQLRQNAARHLRGEAKGVGIEPSELVNEAYLNLFGGSAREFENRGHFMAVAARAMRFILVDLAVHFARAVKHSLAGDSVAALAAIERASASWPDTANAWAWGEILLDLGRPAEASEQFLLAAGNRPMGIRFDSPALWVLCHARAAAALEAAGKDAAARMQWMAFGQIWGSPRQYQLTRRGPGHT